MFKKLKYFIVKEIRVKIFELNIGNCKQDIKIYVYRFLNKIFIKI